MLYSQQQTHVAKGMRKLVSFAKGICSRLPPGKVRRGAAVMFPLGLISFYFLTAEIPKGDGSISSLPAQCNGMFVVSAYCRKQDSAVLVEMSTAHVSRGPHTPFSTGEAWCFSGKRRGSNLQTLYHKTTCEIPTAEGLISIKTKQRTWCTFRCEWTNKVHLDGVVALMQVRNTQNLGHWVDFHMNQQPILISHLVVYDDCSALSPSRFLTNAGSSYLFRLPNFCDHGSRQFVAMQDFLFRFEVEWVLQLDDDCFFNNSDILLSSLKDESISKLHVASAFYGACVDSDDIRLRGNLSQCFLLPNNGCALLQDIPNQELYSLLGARSSQPGFLLPWSVRVENLKIRGDLCFARGSAIQAGVGVTHDWVTRGKQSRLNETQYHFKHMKLPPLSTYLAHVKDGGLWGSTLPTNDPTIHWQKLANFVCSELLEKEIAST